jgi:hypothetical protein
MMVGSKTEMKDAFTRTQKIIVEMGNLYLIASMRPECAPATCSPIP